MVPPRRPGIAGEAAFLPAMRHDSGRGTRHPAGRAGAHPTPAAFAQMKEYQAVVHRLSQRSRDDEDALTDLLNERSRSGWELSSMSQDADRLVLIFARDAQAEE